MSAISSASVNDWSRRGAGDTVPSLSTEFFVVVVVVVVVAVFLWQTGPRVGPCRRVMEPENQPVKAEPRAQKRANRTLGGEPVRCQTRAVVFRLFVCLFFSFFGDRPFPKRGIPNVRPRTKASVSSTGSPTSACQGVTTPRRNCSRFLVVFFATDGEASLPMALQSQRKQGNRIELERESESVVIGRMSKEAAAPPTVTSSSADPTRWPLPRQFAAIRQKQKERTNKKRTVAIFQSTCRCVVVVGRLIESSAKMPSTAVDEKADDVMEDRTPSSSRPSPDSRSINLGVANRRWNLLVRFV